MQTSSTATYEDVSANGAFLRQVLDRFIGILGEADTAPIFAGPDSVDELRHTFNTSLYLPKSLLVVRIASRVGEGDQIDPSSQIPPAVILQELKKSCHVDAHGASIGNGEFALLIPGLDQCGELIPRVEGLLSRAASGYSHAKIPPLKCHVGLARCPIDGEDFDDMMNMASAAAEELMDSEAGYQFINRHHRRMTPYLFR